MQLSIILLLLLIAFFVNSSISQLYSNDDTASAVCLVPWTSEGSVEIRGNINDDLLTVNAGVTVALRCRSRFSVQNGTNIATCGDDGRWQPKLGTCAPALATLAGQTTRTSTATTRRTTAMTTTTPEPEDVEPTTTTQRTTSRSRNSSAPSCGLSKYPFAGTRTQRVIGQVPTLNNEFPWQVRVMLGSSRLNMLCAGVIVDRFYILTTASCVTVAMNTPRNSLRVIAGGHILSAADSTEQQFEVASRIVHPLYQDRNRDYNFAMLKLSEPIVWNDNVNRVCLVTNLCLGEAKPGTYCATSGWNNVNRTAINVLQKNMGRVGWAFECRTQVGRDSSDLNELTDRQICVGFPSIPFDAKADMPDVAQPLVCQNTNGVYFLNGIFSHRIRLADQRLSNGTISSLVTDIYARPCSVQNWIESTIASV